MPKILIADSHIMERNGLKMLVERLFPFAEITAVVTVDEMLGNIKTTKYDLCILDMNLPDIGNFTLFEQALGFDSKLKAIIYSMSTSMIFALKYLQLGAYGYVEKSAPEKTIEQAINIVMQGRRFFSEEVLDQMSSIFRGNKSNNPVNPFETLTTREMEVCMCFANGAGITKASQILHLSVSTVATLKRRIFNKLNIDTLFELIQLLMVYNICSIKSA